MMNPIRQELLAVLTELSSACPEIRFGQLIANLSTLARGLSAEGLWDAEDEELLIAARQQLAYFVEDRPAMFDQENPSEESLPEGVRMGKS
jgi:hypothetical protein